jgi:hypothetical protein
LSRAPRAFLPPGLPAASAHLAPGLGRNRAASSIGELHSDNLMKEMALYFSAERIISNRDFPDWHPLTIEHI